VLWDSTPELGEGRNGATTPTLAAIRYAQMGGKPVGARAPAGCVRRAAARPCATATPFVNVGVSAIDARYADEIERAVMDFARASNGGLIVPARRQSFIAS